VCGKLGHFARDCPTKGSKEEVQDNYVPPSSSKINISSNVGFVDTHCHIDYILQKARVQTVNDFFKHNPLPPNCDGIISIYCDSAALSPSFGTWRDQLQHPKIYGAFGIHPHNAKYYNASVEERIVECLKDPKAVAWGETGLDFHYNNSEPAIQRKVFADQCKKAVEVKKPLIVHSRAAEEDTVKILKENVPQDWKIHIHCFNDSGPYAKTLLQEFPNLFIGFTGAITFQSAENVRNVIKSTIPLERLLLETDGPYMAPAPMKKGTIAQPAHIPLVANKIAELKGVTLDEVLTQARKNTKTMYGI